MYIEPTSGEKKLVIGLDFDETFTLDPRLWQGFVRMAARLGHKVVMVTGRADLGEQGSEVRDALKAVDLDVLVDVVFAAKDWKFDAAVRAGLDVDIWIDDMPNTVMRPPILIGGS